MPRSMHTLGNSEKKSRGTAIQGRQMSSFADLLSVKRYCARRLPTAAAAGLWSVEEGEDRIHKASWQGGLANPAQLYLDRQSPALKSVPCHPGSGRDWFWPEVSLGCWGQKFCQIICQQFITPIKKWVHLTRAEGNTAQRSTKAQQVFKARALGGPFPCKSPHDPFQQELCWVCPVEKLTEQHLHQPQPFTLRLKNKKRKSKEIHNLLRKSTMFDSPWIKKC